MLQSATQCACQHGSTTGPKYVTTIAACKVRKLWDAYEFSPSQSHCPCIPDSGKRDLVIASSVGDVLMCQSVVTEADGTTSTLAVRQCDGDADGRGDDDLHHGDDIADGMIPCRRRDNSDVLDVLKSTGQDADDTTSSSALTSLQTRALSDSSSMP